VLQLVHGRVIDTSALFPHPTGLPYKHSLKKLAKECLGKDIQDNGKGEFVVHAVCVWCAYWVFSVCCLCVLFLWANWICSTIYFIYNSMWKWEILFAIIVLGR